VGHSVLLASTEWPLPVRGILPIPPADAFSLSNVGGGLGFLCLLVSGGRG